MHGLYKYILSWLWITIIESIKIFDFYFDYY